MPEYCSQSDVVNRLTDDGLLYLADRDQDGTVTSGEKTRYLDAAIEHCGLLIDVAIQHLMRPAYARGQVNDYLKHICVDLVIGRLARLGGGEPSITIVVTESEAKKRLERVRSRQDIIPGMAYPLPGCPTERMRPSNGMVVNPR